MTAAGAPAAWAAAACAFAALLGLWGWDAARRWQRRRRHRRALGGAGTTDAVGSAAASAGGSADDRVVAYLTALTRRLEGAAPHRWALPPLGHPAWFGDHLARAGLGDAVSVAACGEARVRLAAAGAALGGALGMAASPEAALLLAGAGGALGWRAPRWAVARRSRRRAEEMERHLSEMLDVVALGLRSGLSFDRSLALYGEHFDTLLAASLTGALRQWECGLATREEALRRVAASYDSPPFTRVVENVVRSLRFGASMADSLEDAAREARASYRARLQEQVAKAPVKMMVPTATLILPAMLMLVLGPVMLELIGGFS